MLLYKDQHQKLCVLAMIRLDKKLEKKIIKSKMLLQIHDELIFEVPKKMNKKMMKL